MRKAFLLLLILVVTLSTFAQECPEKPEWNFATGLECWVLTQNLEGVVNDGVLNLTITGADPFMHSPAGLDILATDSWEIYLGMKNNTTDTSGQVYFTTNTGGWSQELSRSFALVPNDSLIREYRIDMSIVPTWTGIVEQIRMDPLATASSGTVEIDYILIVGLDCEKQYISFPSPGNKTIYDEPFVLEASSSSELAISYAVTSGPATVEDSLLSLTGETGVVVLTASQTGTDDWCPATEVKQVFFVNDTIEEKEFDYYRYTDQWVVIDALGRSLPAYESTGEEREDKLVGIFYYVWMGTHGEKVYDITEILKKPEAEREWGGVGSFHFWGEPEQGYFRSEDPWVIRRDLQMLSNAKVDFMFFDVTNAVTYLDVIDEVCRVSEEMRSEGIPTPDICFLTNANSGSTMNKVFNQFYGTGKYQDLWFFWEGKPLIMGHADDPALLPHVKDFFTIKYSWAWTSSATEPDHWQWLDRYPQDYGWNEAPDVPEQISVSVAHHPANPLGKSYSKGSQPAVNESHETEYTDQGLQFAEQWSRALEVDPPVVMITQWNEWIAQRAIWDQGSGTYAGRPISDGDSYFVDVFSKEFNRDIVPMKDGYTDNYYYQMLSHIRQYKGMEAPQEFSEPKSIAVDGDFSDWEEVSPRFEDPPGDVMHRNFRGYEAGSMFVNESGRNDILFSKVSYDADSLYFLVSTSEDLTPYTDTLWMLLLIDADRSAYTGWEGFDYLIHHSVSGPDQSTLKKWNGNQWEEVGDVRYQVRDKQMELSVSRSDVGMDQQDPGFYFKWSDNPLNLSGVSTFFMNGDAAPDRRFNYHFGSSIPEPSERAPYKDHQVPGVIQFEDFDRGDAGSTYVDADLGNQGGAYRPESSVDMGMKTEGEYFVGWINKGEWMEYTVEVNATGRFGIQIDYANKQEGQKALLFIDGKPVTDTLVFPASGGMDQWASMENLYFQASSGEAVLRFVILEARDNLKLDKISIFEEEVVYPGEGEGLFRSYWTAKEGGRGWFVDSICGEIDPVIDHIWEVSPGCGLDENYWNARWQGQVEALFSETYTFYLTMDNFGKLWLDNELLIDAWKGGVQGNTISATMEMDTEKRLSIQVDYAQLVGNAFISLEWESPSHSREVIPATQLFPEILTGLNPEQFTELPELSIFPNPATSVVNISTNLRDSSSLVRVLDLQGRALFSSPMEDGESVSIQTGEWQEGLYFVEWEYSQGRSVKKLIVR